MKKVIKKKGKKWPKAKRVRKKWKKKLWSREKGSRRREDGAAPAKRASAWKCTASVFEVENSAQTVGVWAAKTPKVSSWFETKRWRKQESASLRPSILPSSTRDSVALRANASRATASVSWRDTPAASTVGAYLAETGLILRLAKAQTAPQSQMSFDLYIIALIIGSYSFPANSLM